MDVDFTDKVTLITGASSGIGEATALLFASLGAQLALVGRNEERLNNVADRCEVERGYKPLQIIADLSTDEGVEKTAKLTIEHFGRLDILINNAGISGLSIIRTADMETFDEVFRIDVRAVYNLTRLLVPALIKSKGNIVNISSIAATTTIVGNLPYAMAKAALDQFSRAIALELAPRGVRVNTISPGITRTSIVKRMTSFSDEEYEEWLVKTSTSIPMGKHCEGLDIANMIAYIACDNSRLVTGTTIHVDGGLQFGTNWLAVSAREQMKKKK